MFRRISVLGLLLSVSCATTTRNALPCSDDDADRCLSFLALLDAQSDTLEDSLERYCVAGSAAACQRLAEHRKDTSLEQLCKNGETEACAVPATSRPLKDLERECRDHVRGMCRALWKHESSEKVALDAPLLEAACTEGIADACFMLSERLSIGEGIAMNRSRAKALAWRSCLAGIREACVSSEIATSKCVSGDWTACEPFTNRGYDDETVHILTRACENGAGQACIVLIEQKKLPFERGAQLTCRDADRCVTLMSSLDDDVLVPLCREHADQQIKDNACFQLLKRLNDIGAREYAPIVEQWSKGECQSPSGMTCGALAQWYRSSKRPFDALTTLCSRDLPWCDAESRKVMSSINECSTSKKAAPCIAAAHWFEQQRDSSHAFEAYNTACDDNEPSACTRALEMGKSVKLPIRKVTELLSKSCQLKSQTECKALQELKAAKALCDGKRRCDRWVSRLLAGTDDWKSSMALLEASCVRGVREDCALWNKEARLRPDFRLERCAANPRTCPKPAAVLVEQWKQCMRSKPEQCVTLLNGIEAEFALTPVDQFELEKVVRSDGWRTFATKACDAGHAAGCKRLAEGVSNQAAQQAFERACLLGDASLCNESAREIWKRRSARVNKSDAMRADPDLKRAFNLAQRGCDLGDRSSCELQADFVESGVAVEPDALGADRIRQRAKQLQPKR